jgi:RND family efflux transporter MFP subunit
VHETSVASKLLAKVVAINVQAGQSVHKGDVLVRLEDEDLQARLEQAEATLASAVAARDQAQIEHQRVQRLFEQNAAAKIELQRAATALKSAEAEVERAQQARREAETVLDYSTIRSPLDAIVVDKQVEAGDTAQPGQVLVTLYDPSRMQLVASVRESLTHRLKIGQSIAVEVDALDKVCAGQISEIVPQADSASRTFSVKVTGPCPPGIYSGMFGRLLIPLDEQEVLVIPRTAVRRVGQLTIVEVADDSGSVLRRRAVQLGRTFGAEVEVLAGLRAGERVGLLRPAPADSNGGPS